MENGSFGNYSELLDFILNQLEKTRDCYSLYGENTEIQGFKKFLLSFIWQKNEHIRNLKELKQTGDLEELFSGERPDARKVNEYCLEGEVTSGTSYLDFLSYMMKVEESSIKLYQFLEAEAVNSEAVLLFKHLADEATKYEGIARDRFELECLK